MAVQLRRRAFTVEEYEHLGRAGILGEDERVELIEGQIVEMNPIGSDHIWAVNRLNRMFAGRGDVTVSVQNPIRVGNRSEPEPDLVVLRADAPQDRVPAASEALLVIEVADTSQDYDRGTKAPVYARDGIPELWIVDLSGERIEAHREPSPDGYRTVRLFMRGERLTPLFAPDLAVEVDGVLGRPD
ncbi:MAG: Uma2 family endonuclease [Chloroflexota bacterium]|nr:Uma2 family endonuclease [Chloroflexota bacterium]